MTTDRTIYKQRRSRLLDIMRHGIAIVPTSPLVTRNGNTHFGYRYDSNFYYLCGFDEPDAVLILVAGDERQEILLCREKNFEREVWDGFRTGPDAAREQFGFDAAYPIAKLDEILTRLICNQPALFYPLGQDASWDRLILRLRGEVQSMVRSGTRAPDVLQDLRALLSEMRLFKDEHELSMMRRAAAISAQAHLRAMQFAQPGQFEYQIEAELLHEFCRHGARYPAYPPIVAGGSNACVLHYTGNNAVLNEGDLLLIDAGCEMSGYAADITRTFPVNGRFSSAQKDVYEIVLAAQAAAIAAALPGETFDTPHNAALGILAQGFIDLRLCRGSLDAVLESEDYKRFYMHRTGHWLGLDVHDCGEYKADGNWRKLQPGMAFTVEPGCYIRPADDVPEALWNIGIRIEDDVVITSNGNEVLTGAAPKEVAEIESCMQA